VWGVGALAGSAEAEKEPANEANSVAS